MDRDIFGQNFLKTRRCASAWGICGIRDAEIIAGPADRVEHRLARWQEAKAVRPTVIVGRPIGVLAGQFKPIRGAVGGSRSPLIFTVDASEDPSGQRVIGGREANGVWVPISPREGLNVAWITQLRPQNGAPVGGAVGGDAQDRAISRQRTPISLSDHIPVPRSAAGAV